MRLCAETRYENYPSLAKRGEGRFLEEYAYSIMDLLVTHHWDEYTLFAQLISTKCEKIESNLKASADCPES